MSLYCWCPQSILPRRGEANSRVHRTDHVRVRARSANASWYKLVYVGLKLVGFNFLDIRWYSFLHESPEQ